LKNYVSKYYYKIRRLPFFIENDKKANLILILGVILFFFIAEDFEREVAHHKKELEFFVGILTESVDSNNFNIVNDFIIAPPIVGIIINEDINHPTEHKFDFPTGRSPPLTESR